jgi:hypothetical protein
MITPQPMRFHEGGDAGRIVEYARLQGRAVTLGELVRGAGIEPSRDLHVLLDGLVEHGSLRRCGPGTFKYLPPAAVAEEPLVVAPPVLPARTVAEVIRAAHVHHGESKRATPVVAAPPSAPTPPPSAPARREAIASAARRPQPPPAPTPPVTQGDLIRALPLDDTPPRHRPSPPAKEKPMPATTALERARALRAQQAQLVKELQVELADLEGRGAEIRETLAELGAETTTAKVVRNGGRKATPRAKKARATTVRKGKGSLADRVLALVQQGKGTSADLVAATGKPQGSVGAALVALQKRGQVKRVGRGRYEAA